MKYIKTYEHWDTKEINIDLLKIIEYSGNMKNATDILLNLIDNSKRFTAYINDEGDIVLHNPKITYNVDNGEEYIKIGHYDVKMNYLNEMGYNLVEFTFSHIETDDDINNMLKMIDDVNNYNL